LIVIFFLSRSLFVFFLKIIIEMKVITDGTE